MGIFLLLLSVEIFLRLIEGRVEVEAMEEVLMRVLEDRGMINRFDIEESEVIRSRSRKTSALTLSLASTIHPRNSVPVLALVNDHILNPSK